MERGLLWLPLLVMLIWLTWSGWNEYQKVKAYQVWSQQFERAKYDIRAVLGQSGTDLTWGIPSRKGPLNLTTFSLNQVESIDLQVDDQQVNLESLPKNGRVVALKFQFYSDVSLLIPFTEIPLAASWARHLQRFLQAIQGEKIE